MAITPAADLSSAVIDITTGLTGGAFVPITRSINTTAPLTGGGDLSADRTLALTTSPPGQVPVGVTRLINTTAPLGGGGDLSADRTLTVSQFTNANPGTVSGSGGGTTNFLRADNTWQAVAGGTGVPATRLINTTLPLTGGGDLTVDRTLGVNVFTPAASGTVPASGGGVVNFLRADGVWVSPGSGTFVRLQATTPGATDVGNAHVSGTIIADTALLSPGVAGQLNYSDLPLAYVASGGAIAASFSGNSVALGGPTSPEINVRRSRGTAASPSATADQDLLGSITFRGRTGSGWATTGAGLQAFADGGPASAVDQPQYLDMIAGSVAGGHCLHRLSKDGLRVGPIAALSGAAPSSPSARATHTLDLVGSLGLNTVTKTGNYTVTNADYRVLCDGTGGGFTITLPAATALSGRTYEIIKIDSASTIITVAGPVSGAASIPLTGPMDAIQVASDGTFWWLIKDSRSNLVGQTVADSTAIANTTTKTAFSTAITIPANRAIFPGTVFIVEAGGTYSTIGAPTLTWFISDTTNSADFATTPAVQTASGVSNGQWQMRASFVFRSIGGTVNPTLTFGDISTADGNSTPIRHVFSPAAGNTSTLASATYVPQVTWGAANAGNTIVMRSFAVFMYGNGARSS